MRFVRLPIIVAGLVLSPLAAAQPAAPTTTGPALSAAECEVWTRELGFARSVAEHDAAAFADFIALGAVFGARGSQPQRGRDAVVAAWAGIVSGKDLLLSWYPRTVAIGGEPDIAYSSGPALYRTIEPNDGGWYQLGEYHSTWHRDDDGVWRVLFDEGIKPMPASEADVMAYSKGRREACPRG